MGSVVWREGRRPAVCCARGGGGEGRDALSPGAAAHRSVQSVQCSVVVVCALVRSSLVVVRASVSVSVFA